MTPANRGRGDGRSRAARERRALVDEAARILSLAGRTPTFFLVGAQKAGTSALEVHLDGDPNVFVTPIKEPYFLATDIESSGFSEKFRHTLIDDDWSAVRRARRHRLTYAHLEDPQAYAELFSGAENHRVRGECSISYLYSKEAPENIARCFPHVKVLILLRDPVLRAFSQFRMQRAAGIESEADFLTALARDSEVPTRTWGQKHLYTELGLYTEQIARFDAALPRGQIHCANFEDLAAGELEPLNSLRSFLGLDPAETPLGRENQATAPRLPRLNGLLYRAGVKRRISRHAPRKLVEIGRRAFYEEPAETIEPETYRQASIFFAGESERLRDRIGLSVPW